MFQGKNYSLGYYSDMKDENDRSLILMVRYDDKEMDMDSLKLCVKELEIIHNNTYFENNYVL